MRIVLLLKSGNIADILLHGDLLGNWKEILSAVLCNCECIEGNILRKFAVSFISLAEDAGMFDISTVVQLLSGIASDEILYSVDVIEAV